MRLLMVGPWRLTAMRRYIDWVVEAGIEVCVADFRTPPQIIRPSGFRLLDLLPPQVTTAHHTRAHGKSQQVLWSAALRLQRVATDFQPDVVHSYVLSRHTDLCLKAGMHPLVVSVWGYLNSLLTGVLSETDRRWLRRLRQGAHTLLLESPNFVQALSQLPHSPLHLACSPIAVDGSRFSPGYQEEAAGWRFVLNIPSDAIVLLSPRGWSRTYGQRHILEAFAQAYHRLGRQAILVFRGIGRMKRPDVLAREVVELSSDLGIAHAIRWIPEIPYEDLPAIYALADIVVNYPLSDAFPATLLEAAACARPVITSDLPAYRNTFIERYCRLVAPENPAALADAIVEAVHSERASWDALAFEARQAVLAEYAESIQKQRLMAVYDAIARSRTLRGW